jgi:hypothetical protein
VTAPLQLTASTSGARFSPCGRYRYSLTRTWGNGPPALFVMLNPSTATADIDDPTIRKCIGFAKRWGHGGIEVVNLFAIRSTDPAGVLAVDDPVGPDNDGVIGGAMLHSAVTIFAWGAHATGLLRKVGPKRINVVRVTAALQQVKPLCLGTSNDGSPRHPLMLPYSTPLQAFGGAHG